MSSMVCFTSLAFLFYLISLCSGDIQKTPEIHVYSYESTISSPDNEILNQTVRGHVLISTKLLESRSNSSAHQILLQIIVELQGSPDPIKGVLALNEWGLVERIFLQSSPKPSDFRINFFKAVAGTFNYHHNFEAGVEYDTSGKCQAYYGEVENTKDEFNLTSVIVIDKQKVLCQPIGQPMDAGVWSISPILKDRRITHSWIRYYFDRKTGLLRKAKTHEQHTIGFSLDNDSTGKSGIRIYGMQKLELLEETSEERIRVNGRLRGLLRRTNSNVLSTAVKELLGGAYTVEHLALGVPQQSTSSGCGIQSVVFEDEALESAHVALSLVRLNEKLKDFKIAIEESARISSAHASLQLIRFLRCLPSNLASVQLAAAALEIIPTTTRDLNEQLQSEWYTQLSDIIINCGTELCLELFRQRIVKVTELAAFSKIGSAAPREVRPVRAYLSDVMWPAVAHISNPSIKMLKELTALCYHSLPDMAKNVLADENDWENPYNCLLAISSIMPRFKGNYTEERLLFSKVEETLTKFITLEDNVYEDSKLNRLKLLAAFTAAEKLKAISLFEPIFHVVRNSKVPSVIRAVGLKAVGNMDFTPKTAVAATAICKLNEFIESPMPGPFFKDAADELILKFGAFSVLLSLDLPAPQVALILSNFASKRQWSLLASCRRLVDSWCVSRLLSKAACRCLQFGGVYYANADDIGKSGTICSPGLAAGWSGLAGTKTAGEVNLIRGDIFDNRPYFLSDYTLQWVTGPNDEIRMSNLHLSLIDTESEVKLVGFSIYGGQLATLMKKGDSSEIPWLSVGFSLLGGTIPPKQVFSGGLTDILSLLFSAPTQPTPYFTTTRLPIDVRRYIPLSSGWMVKNDLMGVMSIEFSGALNSRLFSQSGTVLIRTRASIAMENIITTVIPRKERLSVVSVVCGAATAARYDFLIHMEMANMPESICMQFQRSRMMPSLRWTGKLTDSPILGERNNLLPKLPKFGEISNDYYNITQVLRFAPESYFLGELNAARCRKMTITNEWS